MRLVIQRVSEASVAIDGQISGSIRRGLLALVAFESADSTEDIEWASGKLVRMRLFDDEQGVMNRSVIDVEGELLLVSQFTLFASTAKGNRPSYQRAAPPAPAVALYEQFLQQVEADLGKPVQSGVFGADMRVSLVNEGPVTILVDSRDRE